ncbi:hypothetical protein [Psychrobacter fozii]|uniref:hypothetical protein n=1 Tax=Psychrobacter fozii TaxID=198480 RepID=UPI001918A1E2|nr:hypothetical protein [Psychrobacter fozii]
MKRLSMLLVSGALAVSAHAVDWSKVSESQTGSIFSLDLESIEGSDINIIDEKDVENITVSIRRTYPTQTNEPKEDNAKKDNAKKDNIHHSDQQLLISCKDASYYRRAYVNYGAKDKVLASWQSEKPILTTKDFKTTTPNTVGRTLVEQACENYEQAEETA